MADIRPRGDRTRFIDAFLSVITRAIYQPKRIDKQFRPPTPQRKVHGRGASWRDINPASAGTQPLLAQRAKAHKKWTKQVRKERAFEAAYQADRHDRGLSNSHHKSARTLRRIIERRGAGSF